MKKNRLCITLKNCVRGSSSVIDAQTRWRQPELADLLIAEDRKEIDVSRVQMLFFTVSMAFFVILKVGSSYESCC